MREKVVAVAIRMLATGNVYTTTVGIHSAACDEAEAAGEVIVHGFGSEEQSTYECGYVTTKGRFLVRDDAFCIANEAGQIIPDSDAEHQQTLFEDDFIK